MAKKFKYDIYTLIEVIESKECLWDKTKEVSKDKILRRNAWRDVCAFLEPNFEDMDQKNKDEITSAVMNEWLPPTDFTPAGNPAVHTSARKPTDFTPA
ncbi:unnamed protein product [Arctia plantaginis]|uniref:MADF domain-containing protein n=1 Tax=Arctia plantaginis TaxID=874455 RepID=A0A8S1B5G5_ARCPL|nr:unnamed protein product [Arctia plantaginis]